MCIFEPLTCLGWAVYVANGSAASMVPSTHTDWVDEWGKDVELIFDGNGEFIRYHRGEKFGSKEWREDWISRFEPPSAETDYSYDDKGQGSLF